MPDPQPLPERPKYTPLPRREPLEQPKGEWQVFSALPPPVTKLGFPQTETATNTQTAVQTEVKVATWQKRIGSFALDFGVGLGASYVAQGLAALVGSGAEVVDWVGYGAFFTTWMINRGYLQSRPQGQSIGKWLLNIKTIDTETELSPSLIRSVAREGVMSVLILTEALVVPLGADALFAIFDKQKRQSIHDRAGRTQVVEAETGFHLDEKAIKALQEILEGDAADDVKGFAADLLKQAQRNDTVKDVSKQVQRVSKDLGRNTSSIRQRTSKQVQSWVEMIKEKIDN